MKKLICIQKYIEFHLPHYEISQLISHYSYPNLGMDKFGSLFVFYATGCIVSLIVLVIENIFKCLKNQSSNNSNEVSTYTKLKNIEKSIQGLDIYGNDKNINEILVQMQKILENAYVKQG